MRFLPALGVLGVLVLGGCGGGGGATPVQPGQSLTAQQLLETCAAPELEDFAGLLDLFQGLLEGSNQAPLPELDLLTALLTGRVPFTWDVDEDGAEDLSGLFFFTDSQGQVTIPIAPGDLGALLGGDPQALADALAAIPAGTTLHLEFDLDGLLQQESLRSGEGEFEFRFGEGGVESVSGAGIFSSGDCSFDFSFDDIPVDLLALSAYPIASLGFDLRAGTDRVGGSIELDGTSRARVEAALNGGTPEVFFLDLSAPGAGG